ncbi:citrulline utilization hydrolase CtlX [Flaviaesturariibacter amylovorans]|uniref:Arginine deiminase-related protein n=1 Tax=Flaviaesturariibacter amylovorans TaxID=1084520 RepID=A0ABP8HDX2_9BACT
MSPLADKVLMVRPAAFCYNEQTAANNHFQQSTSLDPGALQQQALQEFDGMVRTLVAAGIEVLVVEDTPEPIKPDALFPNNWISTTPDGRIHLYPMFAPNRRAERRKGIVDLLQRQFNVGRVNDWSFLEEQEVFIEGTGSIVFDHAGRTAYAALSPRTDRAALSLVANAHGYEAVAFDAQDAAGRAIYHTNVLLSIGQHFALGCGAAFTNSEERTSVQERLSGSGHEWIDITFEEMAAFGANLLQVRNKKGDPCIVLSATAQRALAPEKLTLLEQQGTLVPVSVPTIETVNGGSVRCMLAEIFLEEKERR